MGLLRVYKASKVYLLVVYPDTSYKPILRGLPEDSFEPGLVEFAFASVQVVLGACCGPEIFYPVVQRVVVNMIQHLG